MRVTTPRNLHCLFFTARTATPSHLSHPNDYLRTEKLANDHLSWLCKHQLHREALDAFHSIQSHAPHFHLSPSTYRHLLLACSHLRSPTACRSVYCHLSLSGILPDLVLSNHVLNAFGKCGSPDDARHLFDEMPERNAVTWTAAISSLANCGQEREAVGIYLQMLHSGVSPDKFALAKVVAACATMGDGELGRQLHCHVVKWGYTSDQLVFNTLLSLHGNCGLLYDAVVDFSRIPQKNLVSWATMISGLARQGQNRNALICFRQMLRMGSCTPNGFVFGSVLFACRRLLEGRVGEQIHASCIKFGFEADNFAGCSLTQMYSHSGNVGSALGAFEEITSPDLVSWNSIIRTLARADCPDQSMLFFSNMRRSGLEPDDVTLRHLLCGFADPTWLHQGKSIHAYTVKLGFIADASSCNTLLTMYSRCLDYPNACSFFGEMEGKRDVVSWNIILKACLMHAKVNEVLKLAKVVMDGSECEPDDITLSIILSCCAEIACLKATRQVHAYGCKVGLEFDLMVASRLVDTYVLCGSSDDAEKMSRLSQEIWVTVRRKR